MSKRTRGVAMKQTQTIKPVTLGTGALGSADVLAVARHLARVTISPAAIAAMRGSRAVVESILGDGHAHYGINTGFGSLSKTRVPAGQLRELQRNLIRSHASGVGEALPTEVVRGMMLLLAASLCRGVSGVRPVVAQTIVAMLNAGIVPVVPAVGSVGASGDLAPLAAVARAMLGEGEVEGKQTGTRRSAAAALKAAGIEPVTLEAKEGLALINGTHLMASLGALLVEDASVLMDAALVAAAMSIDASRASHSFLDPRVHAARGQPGQARAARAIAALLRGSEVVESHKVDDPRVQDPYCLRCAPQVLGAAMDALDYVKQCVAHELGGVTDNPLVFGSARKPRVISAGNFHGMPLAIPLDCAAIALTHVAGIAERRVFWMLSAADPESHLPPYLARGAGVSSGLMIAQYTAAACCNEAITLCTPASVSNISTSAGIEDYNSFGPRAGLKARRVLELARYVVAIELMCAAEGLDYHRPLRSGAGVERAHRVVRGMVRRLDDDRSPTADVEAIASAVARGVLGDQAR